MSMTRMNRQIKRCGAALAAVCAISLIQMAWAQDATPGDPTPTAEATMTPTPDAASPTPTLTPEPSVALATATPELSAPTPMPSNTPLPSPTPVFVGSVTAIGDSVMLGAARELRRTIASVEVDARVSRQANAVIQLVQSRRDSGRLGEVIILHIGNNGPITTTQFDQLMEPLKDARQVVVVNVRVPRRWEAGNNVVLAEGVKRYPNAVLMDWNAFTRANPGLIGGDGVHLGARSARAYTALVVDALTSPLAVREAPQDIAP
jgi:hypothetical protein